MKITRTTTLDADVDDVFAIITSREHQEAKLAAQTDSSSVEITERAGGAVGVHTDRELPTEGMPGPMVSIVGSTLAITEQQSWGPEQPDGSRTADLEITVKGAPVRLVGRIYLYPTAGGRTLAVDADLTCSLPLVGKKVEAAAAPAIEESFDLEVGLLTERLS